MIIYHYLKREVLHITLAITSILVFIFLCNQLIRYLDYVATGKYAAGLIAYIVLLQLPVLFGLLLPLGLFLAILLGYGRLYADSEMIVFLACGVSRQQLLAMALRFSIGILIIVFMLVNGIGPIVAKKRDKMMDIAGSASVFQTIVPGKFTSTPHGERVFYVEKMPRDRSKMKNIFVAQRLSKVSKKSSPNMQDWVIISSKRAYPKIDHKTGDRFMVATKGYRYRGVAGRRDFEEVSYDKYGVRMDSPSASNKNEGVDVIPTMTLLKKAKQKNEYMAELQWRLSMPFSVIVLVLLAVPLSRVQPRQGRFVQFLPGILIYICYANLMLLGKSWLGEGKVPMWLGLWWVHLLVLLIALWLYIMPSRQRYL